MIIRNFEKEFTMKHSTDYNSRFRILKGGKISIVVSALITGMSLLQAAPSGGVVTAGSASIAQNGSVTTITQTTNKAAINWQNFSIGKSETVNFNQPNASSITLNRVVGNEKSVIDGALNANGQVFILNSNGVLFSKNASINTAGLVATTMNLSNTDFMNGNYAFKGDSQASIINQGTINISDKGYAALFGKEVKNEGFIKATLGKVELVGAKEVTLNLNGNSLVNLKVNKGVLDALVENKGAIYANGGEVYLTINAVNELLKGVVNNTGIIEANSIDDITGKVELYAHGGEVQVGGTLEADGGFIETSGKDFTILKGATIKTAQWLIDPVDITIDSTLATTIEGALASADVTIETTSSGASTVVTTGSETSSDGDTTDGDIYVNSNITWSTNKKLTLKADDQIYVNATIKNTNTTNGCVYFHAANTTNKVIFGASGLVSIYNVFQLQWMNQALVGKYELGGNIDASATASWNSIEGFVPIGNNTTPFTGSFDGLGHTIDSLYINRPSTDKVGLFGRANTGATIKNIGLTNATITGQYSVGGLVGFNYKGIITDAYATGNVTGQQGEVGGLVGANYGSITNAYATSKVSGTQSVGGLVGYHREGSITNAYATGKVSNTTSTGTGGLVGRIYDGTITNVYATGDVSGADRVGGLVGYIEYDGSNVYHSIITNAYATGNVSGTSKLGGLVGENYQASINKSYWNTQTQTSGTTTGIGSGTTSTGVTGKTTADMKTLLTYTNVGWTMTGTDGVYPTLTFGTGTNAAYTWQMIHPVIPPTPTTTTTNNQRQTPDVTAIVNGTAITPPILPNFVLLTQPVKAQQQFSFGGQTVQLASIPSTDVASQLVGTKEARAMVQGADVGDLRIPLGQNSQIQLVNGGVNLPVGLDQEYFMAQR